METFSATETARRKRVAKLSEKLSSRLRVSPARIRDLCADFDEAVEFAALERTSMADAIASFIGEGYYTGPTAAAVRELGRLAGSGAPRIDIAAMKLPVIPKQASLLLRASPDEVSAIELARIADTDPVLTGNLLSTANSALFGSRYEIVRVVDAVMRIGIPEARKVLIGACLHGIFASKPLQDIWKHSEAVALAAYDLASLAGLDPETAYVAGLLHDIGRLGLARLPANRRIEELEWIAAGFPVAYAETLAYGTDHATLGGQCLLGWDLPECIVGAVALHHRPEYPASPLGALLTLAEDFTAQSARMPSEDLWPDMRRLAACTVAEIVLGDFAEFNQPRPAPLEACV